jgi:hypothetical protein
MTPDRDRPGPAAESDVSMALGTAFVGTLMLGQLVGAETPAELPLLLAVVAATALVFEKLALPAVRKRTSRRDGSS